MDSAELRRRLNAILAPRGLENAIPAPDHLEDLIYYLPTRREVDYVLEHDELPPLVYKRNLFDCEDFAYRAKFLFALHRCRTVQRDYYVPFAFGIVCGVSLPQFRYAHHCANIVVTSDQDLLFVDTTDHRIVITPLAAAHAEMELHRITI